MHLSLEKYSSRGVDVSQIEEFDYVWKRKSL